MFRAGAPSGFLLPCRNGRLPGFACLQPLEPFQVETRCVLNHTVCRFAEKCGLSAPILAGRRGAASPRSAFSMATHSSHASERQSPAHLKRGAPGLLICFSFQLQAGCRRAVRVQACFLALTARAMPPRMTTVQITRRSVMASDRNMAPSTAVMIGMASWMMEMATRLYLGTTRYHRI